MTEKLPVDGNYIMYRGKPLIRENNFIVYGDMREKCYLLLMILSNKTVDGFEVPDNILIQILTTGAGQKIVKQGTKNGLYDALDIGVIWLDRALSETV